MPLRDFPCRDTAIDPGSRTSRVHVRGRGVVAVVPSLLALCERTGQCLAAGGHALALHAEARAGCGSSAPSKAGCRATWRPPG